MTTTTELETPSRVRRILGQLSATEPGPSLVCIGSMHGNEPAGTRALQRVFAELTRDSLARGTFIGLGGNLTACARRQRFVDRDLNRAWTNDCIAALRETAGAFDKIEDRELLELLTQIERVVGEARGDVHFLDLHTTSGHSPPFATVSDTLRNRHFALHYPAPIVIGLEEQLDGTLLSFLDAQGHITMGFEGGQHESPEAVDHTEAAIWIALHASGLLPLSHPRVARSRRLLGAARGDLPRVFEVRYRYAIEPHNDFRMRAGYSSFQRVEAGDVLADDHRGEVRAPEAGRILMPLYQAQGEDGFFLMREFRTFWLRLSGLLRRIRADRLAHLLPGVRRDPERPDLLLVDRRTARWYALEIFHLLGYRKKRVEGDTLVVSRRGR